MAIFNSYVKLPEGNLDNVLQRNCQKSIHSPTTDPDHPRPIAQRLSFWATPFPSPSSSRAGDRPQRLEEAAFSMAFLLTFLGLKK